MLFSIWTHCIMYGRMNLNLDWDTGMLVLFYVRSIERVKKRTRYPSEIWLVIGLRGYVWQVRMNIMNHFTGNDTNIKGCNCTDGERERERNKNILCPKKCPERNLYFFGVWWWWKCLKWNVVRVCGCTVERSQVSNVETHSRTASGWLFSG